MTNPHPNPTDFAHEIRIRRIRILAGSVTSLVIWTSFCRWQCRWSNHCYQRNINRRIKGEFGYLRDPSQVTFGSQFQSLLLSPHVDATKSTYQSLAGRPRTQRRVVCNESVEQPLIDEVEQLREQLNCQRGIDPRTQQQWHCPRQQVDNVVCDMWKQQTSRNDKLQLAGCQRRRRYKVTLNKLQVGHKRLHNWPTLYAATENDSHG